MGSDCKCERDINNNCECSKCLQCDGNGTTCLAPDCKCDHCATCNNNLCSTCEFPGCNKCLSCKACTSAMCSECSAPNCSDCLKCAKCVGVCEDCTPPNCSCEAVKFTRT